VYNSKFMCYVHVLQWCCCSCQHCSFSNYRVLFCVAWLNLE